MPEIQTIFEQKAGDCHLGISNMYDMCNGTVIFQSPDTRFSSGGMHVVFESLVAIINTLADKNSLSGLGIGLFQPVLPPDSDNTMANTVMQDFVMGLKRGTREIFGDPPLTLMRLPFKEGLTLLTRLGPRFGMLSAEYSGIRILLLEEKDGKEFPQWDLLHDTGSTTIGIWNENISQRPGWFAPGDTEKLDALKQALTASHKTLTKWV